MDPLARALPISSGPAATRLSLFASASVLPRSTTRSPGISPAVPTIADSDQSDGIRAASSIAASPAAALVPDPASASRKPSSRLSSAITATSARSARAICASRATLRPPVRATVR